MPYSYMIPSATSSSISSSSSSPVCASFRDDPELKSDISQESSPTCIPIMRLVWSEISYKKRTVASSRQEPFNPSRFENLKKMIGIHPVTIHL